MFCLTLQSSFIQYALHLVRLHEALATPTPQTHALQDRVSDRVEGGLLCDGESSKDLETHRPRFSTRRCLLFEIARWLLLSGFFRSVSASLCICAWLGLCAHLCVQVCVSVSVSPSRFFALPAPAYRYSTSFGPFLSLDSGGACLAVCFLSPRLCLAVDFCVFLASQIEAHAPA